jgi:pimeloyl-ACP methyl ester carboxylesterase
MTAVFVHGVPETSVIWDPLIAALSLDDAVSLQLPGFGCDLPDGFDRTMNGYADWLVAELAAIDAPIDLVTHDWGALLGMRVMAEHPGRARSWVTDMGDLNDQFEWHDTARTWQTPGEGEAFMDGFVGASDADRAALLVELGVAEPTASLLSAQIDKTMGDSILALYRSAVDIGKEWGPGLDAITAPTLIIEAVEDDFRNEGAIARFVERVGASSARLDGQGHWWMVGDPEASAAAIAEFWAAL